MSDQNEEYLYVQTEHALKEGEGCHRNVHIVKTVCTCVLNIAGTVVGQSFSAHLQTGMCCYGT